MVICTEKVVSAAIGMTRVIRSETSAGAGEAAARISSDQGIADGRWRITRHYNRAF